MSLYSVSTNKALRAALDKAEEGDTIFVSPGRSHKFSATMRTPARIVVESGAVLSSFDVTLEHVFTRDDSAFGGYARKVVARDSSEVNLLGTGDVAAHDQSKVKVLDSVHVDAFDHSLIQAYDYSEVHLYDDSCAYTYHNARAASHSPRAKHYRIGCWVT